MHYQSDKPTTPGHTWTNNELQEAFRKFYAGNQLLLPDDAFYGKTRYKDDIDNTLQAIKAQLKFNHQTQIKHSTRTPFPGICIKKDKTFVITLPSNLIAKPFVQAAALVHLLTHASLASHNISAQDQTQHEVVVTHAAIEAGLGIVLLNGLRPGGFKSLFRFFDKRILVAGINHQELIRLIDVSLRKQPLDIQKKATSVVVPWERQHFASIDKRVKLPQIFQKAQSFHRKSMTGFLLATVLGLSLLVTSIALARSQPAYLNSDIAAKRANAESLEQSYRSCITRLNTFQNQIQQDDLAAERLASAEQVRCKSMQNRYNAAARDYNKALRAL